MPIIKRSPRKSKLLFLIDWENLIINARKIDPTKFSMESGFEKIIDDITSQIGEIVGIFAFLPSDRAMVWGEDLHAWGFNIISCPRAKNKEIGDQDTTDARMLELGEWLINNVNGLTHLCIGSGDKDFSPLMRKAALKGLKRAVVAADLRSLSSEVIKLTDKNPLTKEKMVFLFSPTEE